MKNFIKKINKQSGMTYVEIIVVLSIFSVMSSIVIYNYGEFQARIDLKNLASDIGLKVVQAQKDALSGKLPTASTGLSWKPSYGVYFSTTTPRNFIYFVDLDQNGFLLNPNCSAGSECLENVSITKNNTISAIAVFYQNGVGQGETDTGDPLNDVTVSFSRPDSGATIRSTTSIVGDVSHVQLTVQSPKGSTSFIKIYRSGRIKVN